MSIELCRICGKTIKEKDPINLFEIQNKKILLQIKDLTGVRIKKNPSLPKFMCCICKKDLIDAYKFREDFLKVQETFRVRDSRGSKQHTHKELIEATEFVQVFAIKEEKTEDIDVGDEEKEITIVDCEDLKKEYIFKDNKGEINALELKSNDERTLEDTKAAIEVINNKVDIPYDISEGFSEDEDGDNNSDSNKEFIGETGRSKCTRKSKKSEYPSSEKDNSEMKGKKKKRKDDKKHKNIFMCEQCGNNFSCRHHFKLHLRRHSGDKRCACELCPDKFFTSSELKRHMRKHTGERPFACRHCDRRFTDYSTRLKHERTHTNERPFMCSQCGKSFTTSYILKNHMLTHTGERHFKCDVCNRAFTRRTHLLVHFRSMMHKQAVEKEKTPSSQEELSQAQSLTQ